MTLALKECFINAWSGAAKLNSYVRKQNVACNADRKKKNHVRTPLEFPDLNMDVFV